jgi:hypothetical protein
MIPKDLKKNSLRWVALAVVTVIILVMRTGRNGFFRGKDWILYGILITSIGFATYYRKR